MRRIFAGAGVLALMSMGAMAQDPAIADKLDKVKVELQSVLERSRVMAAGGGVMGKTVKNAPYSATEINESTQTLGDGTRIHNESRTMVYRDSEGRVRRENGDNVSIWDPVANTSYTLDAKTMTARKMPMAPAVFMYRTANGVPGVPAVGVGGSATSSVGFATAGTVRAAV